MTLTLHGISNCDTVRKARLWLDQQGVVYQYRDFRKDGLSEAQLRDWLSRIDRDTLVNRRSPSWRKLPPEVRDNLDDNSAVALLLETPTLIKRPLLDNGTELSAGFSPEAWQSRLG